MENAKPTKRLTRSMEICEMWRMLVSFAAVIRVITQRGGGGVLRDGPNDCEGH